MSIDEKVPCWIVWGLSQKGVPILLACDLSQSVADRHRKAATADERWVRVYVEPTLANHLYASSLSEIRLNVEQMRRVQGHS